MRCFEQGQINPSELIEQLLAEEQQLRATRHVKSSWRNPADGSPAFDVLGGFLRQC